MLKTITFILFGVLPVLASSGYEIPEDNLSKRWGISSSAKIIFSEKSGFSMVDEGEPKSITSVKDIPTTLNQEGLERFLQYGYLEVRETADGYSLIGRIRMRGGMPPKEDSSERDNDKNNSSSNPDPKDSGTSAGSLPTIEVRWTW